MKKTLAALLLALALLTGSAAAFSDVDEGLYYAAPIAWAVERGVTTGTSEDTFSPDALCTRGQIITFLWRSAGSPEPESTVSPYADVRPDLLNQDIYKAILWAGETGVIRPEGPEKDSFFPGEPCGRSEAMLFLWRWSGSPEAGTPAAFTDVSPEADCAPAVAWAVENGITSGTSESTFSPSEPCTRGQIVTFLYRCVNEAGEKVVIPVDPPASPTQEPAEQGHPMRTSSGTGEARSLGLDGSEFTSDGVYEAEASVEVYSPYEAVFTVKVPFPLFQACKYTVRFINPDWPGQDYVFTCLRWDEAFADMIPWEGEHSQHRFADLSNPQRETVMDFRHGEDDRIGGVITWRVSVTPGGGFNFDMVDDWTLSCTAGSSM